MQKTSWIIDDHGDVWPLESGELRRTLSCDLPLAQSTAYMLKNLGFVLIEETRAGVRVSFRPAVVSGVAAIGLAYWIFDRPFTRAALTMIGNPDIDTIFDSKQDFLKRVFSATEKEEIPESERFVRKTRQIDEISPNSPLHLAYRAWSLNPIIADEQEFIARWDELLRGRFTLTKSATTRRAPVISHIGSGYTIYEPAWIKMARGHRHEDGPDHRYGRWIGETHRKTLADPRPVLDDVDALLEMPGRDRFRLRYVRLILPFRRPDGEPALLSASELDDRISLRSKECA